MHCCKVNYKQSNWKYKKGKYLIVIRNQFKDLYLLSIGDIILLQIN